MFLLIAAGGVGPGNDLFATFATLRQQVIGQATAAARVVGTVGAGRTLGDFVKDAIKDPKKQSQVHGLTSGSGTESLNSTYDTKKVKVVQNGVDAQAKALEKSAELKEATKSKLSGKYVTGVEKPLMLATANLSRYSQAVFEATSLKKLETVAKKELGAAVKNIATAVKNSTDPNTAKIIAEEIGILKGLIESTNVRAVIGDKVMGEFAKLENFAKEWKLESAVDQVAQRIISEAKKNEPQAAGNQGNPMGANAHGPGQLAA